MNAKNNAISEKYPNSLCIITKKINCYWFDITKTSAYNDQLCL